MLILIGNSGHYNSVVDSFNDDEQYEVIGNLDIEEITEDFCKKYDDYHICIGDIKVRRNFINKLNKFNIQPYTIIDETANISTTATIDKGSFVGKNVIVNANVHIGSNCIINTGAIIEHDSKVGQNNHIAPASVILGAVNIGDDNFIGANTTIFPCVDIKNFNIIGAGSIIRKNIASFNKIYGVYNGK